MKKNKTLFFDIETGGLDPRKSSVYSISYAHGEAVRSLYAEPQTGTWMSDWAEENVFKQIKETGAVRESEEAILNKFLYKLESLPKGSTVAGWNIGQYPVGGNVPGFDIPFLMGRASEYGLQKKYFNALNRLNIRDLGREFLTETAIGLHKYASGLSPEELNQKLDANLWKQMEPYAREAAEMQKRGLKIPEISRRLAFKQVSGWKQEMAYELLTGKQMQQAHLSEADIGALVELSGEKFPTDTEDFARRWNKSALEYRLQSEAKARISGGQQIPLDEMAARAQSFGVDFSKVEGAIKENKKFFTNPGKIIGEVKGVRLPKVATSRRIVGELWKNVKQVAGRHKALFNIGTLASIVYFTEPFESDPDDKRVEQIRAGELLSVKARNLGAFNRGDDALSSFMSSSTREEYNTIPGMSEQGLGSQIRHETTPFGSAWKGNIVGEGIKKLIESKKLAGNELRAYMRSSAGKKFTANVGGVRTIPTKRLGEGAAGAVYRGYTPQNSEVVLKRANMPDVAAGQGVPLNPTVFLSHESPFINETMEETGAVRNLMESVRSSNDPVKYLFDREVALTRQARAEYGDIVPEVFAHDKKDIVMEYAGTSIDSILKSEKPEDKAIIGKASEFMKKWLPENWAKGSVMHLDPHAGNVTFKEVGGELKFSLIDWGSAFRRSEMTTSLHEPSVRKYAMDKFAGTYDRILKPKIEKAPTPGAIMPVAQGGGTEILPKAGGTQPIPQPGKTMPIAQPGGTEVIPQVGGTQIIEDKSISRTLSSGLSSDHNTISGMPEAGATKIIRTKNTPFGSPWNAMKAASQGSSLFNKFFNGRKTRDITMETVGWLREATRSSWSSKTELVGTSFADLIATTKASSKGIPGNIQKTARQPIKKSPDISPNTTGLVEQKTSYTFEDTAEKIQRQRYQAQLRKLRAAEMQRQAQKAMFIASNNGGKMHRGYHSLKKRV